MATTEAPKRRRGRRGTALATLAIASLGLVAGLAPAAFAQQTDTQTGTQNGDGQSQEGQRPPRPELTDEQKACLEEQGVEKPAADENGERVKPTEEQREKFKAAAEACNIELPAHPGHPKLTDEQKTCLEGQGVEKPAKGEDGKRVKPTEEQRTKFEAAAEACGIDLPERPADAPNGDQAPSDAPSDSGTTEDTNA
jgi:hypothetical protein